MAHQFLPPARSLPVLTGRSTRSPHRAARTHQATCRRPSPRRGGSPTPTPASRSASPPPPGAGPGRRGKEEEEPEQPGTPSRGVKDDISELAETLTRRLWGVVSFPGPPPAEASTPRAGAAAPNNVAVAEISKIASSLMPFGQGVADEGSP
ncbi:unnamed protein product [Urochloa humidicola]